MESLGNLDEVACLSGQNPRIKQADVRHPHHIHPLLVFGEDIEHLLLMYHHFGLVGGGTFRHGDVDTLVIRLQVVQRQIGGRRRQSAVKIPHNVGQAVHGDIQFRSGIHQRYLVVKAQPRIDLLGLRGKHLLPRDGNILRNQVIHPRFETVYILLRHFVQSLYLAVKSFGNRVRNTEPPPRKQVVHRLLQGEEKCPLIHSDTLEMRNVDEPHRNGLVYHVVELLYVIVHIRRKIGQVGFRKHPDDIRKPRSPLHHHVGTVVFTRYTDQIAIHIKKSSFTLINAGYAHSVHFPYKNTIIPKECTPLAAEPRNNHKNVTGIL